jgi:hypothetical protein
MAVAVVDVLEPVQVGDDHGQGAAEALDAGELVRERFLALAPVGQAGEAVDEGLPLDDPVQPDVVEGNDGVRREGGRGHPVLVGEIVAEEEKRAEVDGSRTKGTSILSSPLSG